MRLYRRFCHAIKRKSKLLWRRKREPLIRIDFTFNLRGFGGYKSTLFPGALTREGFIYRSGHLSDVTTAGWDSLQHMGIVTIIDLTSPGEVEIFTGAPDRTFCPLGVETIHMPFKQGIFSMERQVEKYQTYRRIGPEVSNLS
jgi:protein-tyrosine phosphatase